MGFADLLAAGDRAAREILGSEIVYTPGTGAPVTVNGIFDALYVRADPAGEPGISTSGPAVFLTLADLPSDPYTDDDATVTVGGTVYAAHTVQKDGQGAVVMLLHLV